VSAPFRLRRPSSASSRTPDGTDRTLKRSLDLLLLSTWCGLAAGLLEVGARVLARYVFPSGRLYQMSRHFVWTGPLANLLLFILIGLFLALAVRIWPRVAGWLGSRLVVALALLPSLMAAGPKVYSEAWGVLAFGIAIRVVPLFGRPTSALRRRLWWSFPIMGVVVLLLAASVFVGERLAELREAGRPLPPPEASNILLIVLDTVRADDLSLYGYHRSTTPNLDRLAKRGIRFAEARAAAPWTLPSHAAMFTGRLPHDLVTEWSTPLRGNFPTLAEYLGSRGYATAGFVGNVLYCSYATGLDRGFTHYEDYVLNKLAVLQTAGLLEYAIAATKQLTQHMTSGPIAALGDRINRWFVADQRKSAASINRTFLEWLSRRPSTGRPFFVFLNYMDAHASYLPPEGAIHRFGSYPQTPGEVDIVYRQWALLDKSRLPQRYVALGRDCYDDCLGYLDDQLGLLLGELQRQGALDRTLVIVTSDHGEGFGEHGLFDHGKSLYRTEIRVPLLLVLPGGGRDPVVVRETVGLQDLPATITDLLGLAPGSPLPGRSLAQFWGDGPATNLSPAREPVVSELAAPNPINPNYRQSPALRGPLVSIAEGKFVYILNEKDGTEELFDIEDDPRELTTRVGAGNFQTTLERFRLHYRRVRGTAPPAAR
jgi:arylsulfatase A-like enzyme